MIRKIIAALYQASACGVQIYLLVRGICCLQGGSARSKREYPCKIHCRRFPGNTVVFSISIMASNEEIFMGSADWMPRNLDRRVEIVFPVEDERD